MSYFLDTYEWPFGFIAGLIVLVALLLVRGLAVFGAAFTLFLLLLYGLDDFNDGQIENMDSAPKRHYGRI